MSVRQLVLALTITLAPGLLGLGTGIVTEVADIARAREAVENKEYEAAAKLLFELIAAGDGNAEANELLASALLKLKRKDEAAHYFAEAYRLSTADPKDKHKKGIKRQLYLADPQARRRDVLFEHITKRIVDLAEELNEEGSAERALELLAGVLPIARGKNLGAAKKLHTKLASAFEKVDLTAAGSSRTEEGGWPLHEVSSLRYDLKCNLEPEVVRLIGETMDSIYDYYVSLYFDGDDSKIREHRATIRVFGTKPEMDEYYPGDEPPLGWWSPGSSEVVSFDTRTTRTGSLDPLLKTLFHEASHQFMTFMSQGGRAPTWLNEGTSCFFEGAVAMADNRVLWPDAAIARLVNLKAMLAKERQGPTPRQVIEYPEPGSYPADYYAFGWGFVYYLQQYEDPDTLEYVYRPLYARYRDTVTSKPSNSMKLFETTFLGESSPRQHTSFEEFERDWTDWILNQVVPLHLSKLSDRRKLRLAKIELYLAAADKAKDDKKAKVDEAELLRRALGHLEYIHTRIDTEDAQDPELILRQAEILVRLDYPGSASTLFEQWLNLADAKTFEFEADLHKKVSKKLQAIDSKNFGLRRARIALSALINRSRKLLADYEKKDKWPLRSYTFATQLAEVFPKEASLMEDAKRLKSEAREAGVLLGAIKSLTGSEARWAGCSNAKPSDLESKQDSIMLETMQLVGQVNTDFKFSGEYEIRATITRTGKLLKDSADGLVVAGTTTGDSLLIGVTRDGKLRVWQIISGGKGQERSASIEAGAQYELSTPLPTEIDPKTRHEFRAPYEIIVHVHDRSQVTVTVGEADPIELKIETDVPKHRHVGVFVRSGEVSFSNVVVEMYP